MWDLISRFFFWGGDLSYLLLWSNCAHDIVSWFMHFLVNKRTQYGSGLLTCRVQEEDAQGGVISDEGMDLLL